MGLTLRNLMVSLRIEQENLQHHLVKKLILVLVKGCTILKAVEF